MTPMTITRPPAAGCASKIPAAGLARMALYRVMIEVDEEVGLDILAESGRRAVVALTDEPHGALSRGREAARRHAAMERAFVSALYEMDPNLSVETAAAA